MRAELVRDPDGRWELPLLRSALIGAPFVHGFTTRAGGASAPPFDTLNLGGKWGDDPAAVSENRRRLERAAGGPIFTARQVHGAAVARVRVGDGRAAVAALEADGLYTDAPGIVLGVFVADCVPALLVDPRTGARAAVHAGWRGTVAGVLPAAVRALAADFGARPADLRVALGPAIGPCCFEVGPEVVAAFEALCPDARARGIVLPSPRGAPGKANVDLKAANRLLLERAGVDPTALDAGPECTACDRARFFSFRRDGAATGQLMGVVGAAALEGVAPRR
ncbi:MAG TPA: peptidoglycan editing factor PgeF [Polyangia bacterium]|nr:peptidoglycan editing factor PgeF [Polyangia bacterium]